MTWYNTGNCGVTNGSASVTGSGTAWVANGAQGMGFRGPDRMIYEVQSINSDTSLTLATPYQGSTASGQSYSLMPTQDYIRSLASQVSSLIAAYSTIAANAGAGKFGDGTASSPGITFGANPNTGVYRVGSNDVGFAANASRVAGFNAGGLYALDNFTVSMPSGAGTPNVTIGRQGDNPAVFWKRWQGSGSAYYYGRMMLSGASMVLSTSSDGSTWVPQTTINPTGSLVQNGAIKAGGSMIGHYLTHNGEAAAHYWKIAGLPTSTAGTLDHLYIEAVVNDNWNASNNRLIRVLMSNRGTFSARLLSHEGPTPQGVVQVLAYTESDGSVSVYLYLAASTYSSASVRCQAYAGAENGAILYADPALTTAPTGTQSFASNAATPQITIDAGTSTVGLGVIPSTGGSRLQIFGGSHANCGGSGDDGPNGNKGHWVTKNGGGSYDGFAWQLSAGYHADLLVGDGSSAWARRLRVTKTGDLLMGTTSTGFPSGNNALVYDNTNGTLAVGHANGTSSGVQFAAYVYNSVTIGSITQSGTTGVAFNTTSDRRLKDHIAPAGDAGSVLDAIEVVQHDWKSDGSHVDFGVIAQDLHAAFPAAVTPGDDGGEVEKPWQVDYSKLVPLLLKVGQEQRSELQALRARVAALEGGA